MAGFRNSTQLGFIRDSGLDPFLLFSKPIMHIQLAILSALRVNYNYWLAKALVRGGYPVPLRST